MSGLLIIILCALSSTYADWKTVFEDNFDGSSLDTNNWKYEVGSGQQGWGNWERQYYTQGQNVQLVDGKLVIQVKIENKEGYQFTSTRLNSKQGWTFGKFEARAKLPNGKNLWPAIWLMPLNSDYGQWAASGEIDIMEGRGERPNQAQGTIHYGGTWPNNIHSGSGEKDYPFDFSADYHTFGVEWNTTKISWTVDNIGFHSENIDRNMWSGKGNNPYTRNGQPFDQPFFWILNVAVGGTFFPKSVYGPPITLTEAQAWSKPTMEIDFIRVSQWK